MNFNYVIGHYWNDDSGSIGCYDFFGEVHYGPIESAQEMLEYVKSKSPDWDWKIFKVGVEHE